ncbi:hypothetical protein [Polaromonas sp.]|uniref:hypothetical protein n=1 Tax=Polaromonas sp. TaxID=1869339 RepID=UPI002487F3BD|nr:hypothetical protein [Polaromonas sp.]MDI1272272.1 hypothetical protein [Polaromonas sp.]
MISPFRCWSALVSLLLAVCAGPAAAQPLIPPGVHLGVTVSELREAVPGLHPVPRPQSVAGAVGRWRVDGVQQAGLVFDETFFFAGPALQRVELLMQPGTFPPSGEAFAHLVASLQGLYGPELPLHGALSSVEAGSASWVHDGVDILALQSGSAGQTSVRLIYKARVLKDAGEL